MDVNYPNGDLTEEAMYDAITQFMDVYSTILNAIGIDVSDYAEGTSLVSGLEGQEERIHDEVFIEPTLEWNNRNARLRKEAVRTEEWCSTRCPGVDLETDPEEHRDVKNKHPKMGSDLRRPPRPLA